MKKGETGVSPFFIINYVNVAIENSHTSLHKDEVTSIQIAF